ncbi:glycosyltransferase family 4 protein [Cellvibrio sp. UBA7671]|uniref:glycosyltransferase family 4 protein n=1 Tax=Cellvibrio sp. UBA7671 TaxID=1946312 RepID=UPI002F35AAD3
MAELFFAIPGDINTLTGGYSYDRRLIAELQALGHKIEHLHLSNRFPVPDAEALADAAAQFAALPDQAIVIADGLAYGVMDTIAIQHAARLNIIALCHHPLMLEAGLSTAQMQQLFLAEQRALNAAKAVIVTSHMTGKILIEQFAIPATKIVVALPGTDPQTFAPCNGNPPVLLTLATLTRRKAHDLLIDALARIKHLEWSARFVGGMNFDPAWVALLKNKVATYGLKERILFVGNVADSASEYANADLFVLPSLFEGYGMAFAEALSFGLPIVAARTGAVPAVVPDSAGILVAPDDLIALTDALHKLLADTSLRKQFQTGAQAAAHHLPNWKDTAAVVAHLINQTNRKSE